MSVETKFREALQRVRMRHAEDSLSIGQLLAIAEEESGLPLELVIYFYGDEIGCDLIADVKLVKTLVNRARREAAANAGR
jgi:hypothetical protein